VEDVVGDLRALVRDHDPENARAHGNEPEVVVEVRVQGLEAFDRGDVHLLAAVEEADEAKRGLGEVEAEGECPIQDLLQLVQPRDLDRDRVERLELLAKRCGRRVLHLSLSC